MEYQEALDKLHSLRRFGVKPGLERVKELLRRLGDPQQRPGLRYVHIAGTNGKGSCGAMLQSILLAAGRKVGFFSSPHLLHHCERYRIQGRPLSEDDFAVLFSQVWRQIEGMRQEGWESPTEFEAVTALALLAYARQGVEWAVMECGLGGLYDSTNVISAEVALITNVGLDHMEYLGHTVEEIAAQKSGVIHAGQTVVTAAASPAREIIAARAACCGDSLLCLGRDFSCRLLGEDEQGLALDICCQGESYTDLRLPLLGSFQAENAACAVQVASLLGVSEGAIRQGLAQACWPCRLEVVSRAPLVVMDGGHNEDGLLALSRAVAQYWPEKKICGVVGMLDDKRREQALNHILPRLSQVVVTRPGVAHRSRHWQEVGEIARRQGLETVILEDSGAALRSALQSGCDMVLICGSLYLAADLRGRFPLPPMLMTDRTDADERSERC